LPSKDIVTKKPVFSSPLRTAEYKLAAVPDSTPAPLTSKKVEVIFPPIMSAFELESVKGIAFATWQVMIPMTQIAAKNDFFIFLTSV
jgi:hypothetical protein